MASAITVRRQVTRAHKYHAQRTVVDGIAFASKAEARRYGELLLLARAGVIRDLVRQPKYPLTCNGGLVGHYIADFSYVVVATMEVVVEDVKGVLTDLYRWKKKHFELQYARGIVEIGRTPKPRRRAAPSVTRQPKGST